MMMMMMLLLDAADDDDNNKYVRENQFVQCMLYGIRRCCCCSAGSGWCIIPSSITRHHIEPGTTIHTAVLLLLLLPYGIRHTAGHSTRLISPTFSFFFTPLTASSINEVTADGDGGRRNNKKWKFAQKCNENRQKCHNNSKNWIGKHPILIPIRLGRLS